ncbi:MAG: hypothetical protein K2L02_00225 [Clostridia bacterium]|nr:hypothetical protein [Clostridia bacterium]
MAKHNKDYFGLSLIVSIILAIIPFTSWLLGAITRFKDGAILAGIIRLIGLGFILWILDLIFMIAKGQICRILNI